MTHCCDPPCHGKDDIGCTGSCGVKEKNSFPKAWLEPKTKKNVTKGVRALRLHALKTTAMMSNELFGLASKMLVMVFSLKKFPVSKRAFSLQRPHGRSQEAMFLKTSTGKKILSVPLGTGKMNVNDLVDNATAILDEVSKTLDCSRAWNCGR